MRYWINPARSRSDSRELAREPEPWGKYEAVAEFKDHFSTLVENLPDAVFVSRGTLLWCNDTARKMLGYESKDELIGRGPDFFLPEDDVADRTGEIYRALEEGGRIRGIAKVRKKDASVIEVDYTVSRIPGKEPAEYVTSCRDITEQRRIDRILRESEQKYRNIVELAPDTIITIDQWGVITSCNSAFTNLTGYSKDEVIGKYFTELPTVRIEDAPAFLEVFAALSQGQESQPLEFTWVHKDGSIRLGEARVSVMRDGEELVGIQVIAVDATQRKYHELALRAAYDELEARVIERTSDLARANEELCQEIADRKAAETALRQSEQLYSALLSNLTDALFLFEDGSVTWCNDTAALMFGYSREELVGRKADFFHSGGDGAREFARMVSGEERDIGIVRGVTRFEKKDGNALDIEYSLSRIPGKDPVRTIAVARDITERKRVEDALRESEHNYSALVSNLGDAIFRYSEGKLDWWNDKVEEITGYTREELGRHEIQFFMPPELDLRKMSRAVGKALEERDVFRGVSKAIRKDGVVRDIEFSASLVPGKQPVELVGIVRDVTEHNRMQAALQESEANYRVLFESTFDAIIVIDVETMKIVFGNRRAALLFGFNSAAEGIGKDILDFIHPEDREEIVKGLLEDIYSADRRKKYEIRAYTADGREMWVSALATRIEFRGKLAALVSVRDVTGQRREEEEKRRLEEQLQLTGRLAAVGELAAGVAHELNNPLAAIQAYAEFLAARKDLDETLQRDLEIVYSEALRAGKITRNLLSFSRPSRPEKKLMSVNEVLERSLELQEYRLRDRSFQVWKELDPALPEIMADSHQIQQVFVNIIINAEQAMVGGRKGGIILVKTEKVEEKVRIILADDGPGIPEENLKRIFDPFFTTREVGQGTGLGLSICYGIITEHGGTIHVSSKVGNGTTFTIELPLPAGRLP